MVAAKTERVVRECIITQLWLPDDGYRHFDTTSRHPTARRYRTYNRRPWLVQDYLYLCRPILFAVVTACQLIYSSSTEPCSERRTHSCRFCHADELQWMLT